MYPGVDATKTTTTIREPATLATKTDELGYKELACNEPPSSEWSTGSVYSSDGESSDAESSEPDWGDSESSESGSPVQILIRDPEDPVRTPRGTPKNSMWEEIPAELGVPVEYSESDLESESGTSGSHYAGATRQEVRARLQGAARRLRTLRVLARQMRILRNSCFAPYMQIKL